MRYFGVFRVFWETQSFLRDFTKTDDYFYYCSSYLWKHLACGRHTDWYKWRISAVHPIWLHLTAFEIYSPHWHSLASSKIRYSVTFFFLVSLVNQDMNEYVIVKELQGKRVPDLLKCPEVNMLSFIHIQLKGSWKHQLILIM